MKMAKTRWFLELLLSLFEAALRHLRDGPERAAALAQRDLVKAELAKLDQEHEEKGESA